MIIWCHRDMIPYNNHTKNKNTKTGVNEMDNWSKLCQLYKESETLVKGANIEIGNITNLRINNRLKSVYGRARRIGNEYTIEIAGELLNSATNDGIKNTIIHEILHTCKGCMNHGENWKRKADIIKNKYGIEIKRTSTMEEKGYTKESIERVEERMNSYKYIIGCDCGAEWKYKSMCNSVRHPERYMCSTCKKKLKRIV